ncbi:MAG: hypothetical protein HYX92_15230 [Chloroflexi bacterium]|nr:hypothetical protein [Chloroflexota bacterium]
MTQAKYIFVYHPTGRTAVTEHEMAPRAGDLNGKVVGFLDNGKTNCDVFMDRVQQQLSKRFNLSGVIRKRKSQPAKGAAESTIEELASKADVVINGTGD